MVISKEDALGIQNQKQALRWISLFSKFSWIIASGLSYELGVNNEKKVNGN